MTTVTISGHIVDALAKSIESSIKETDIPSTNIIEELSSAGISMAELGDTADEIVKILTDISKDEAKEIKIKKALAKKLFNDNEIVLKPSERKVLSTFLSSVKIDFGAICAYSGISDVTKANKFEGFPLLKKSVSKKLRDIEAALKTIKMTTLGSITIIKA